MGRGTECDRRTSTVSRERAKGPWVRAPDRGGNAQVTPPPASGSVAALILYGVPP
jgi:hypothetical protein